MMKSVYDKKNECCGCNACYEICPRNAITMVQDQEGFYYPEIDQSKCVDCGLCTKVCGFKSPTKQGYEQKYFAAKNKIVNERLKSRSGGVFFCAAKNIINAGGVVYGVIIDDDMSVHYERSTTVEGCRAMQGSKYVESDITGIFKEVKQDLNNGKTVLFSGTACHVAGLLGFLKNNRYLDNLYTIDIVCHGVSSRLIYQDYLHFVSQKYGGEVRNFNFRDKAYGWDAHVETFVINGKTHGFNNYTQLFYCNRALRPSCGNCMFASYNRVADLTIADFWGLKKIVADFDDNRGVSSVMINSDKGERLFAELHNSMECVEVSAKDCNQPNLNKPSSVPDDRENFWKVYKEKGFKAVLVQYGRYDLVRRLLWIFRDLPKLKHNMIDVNK